MNKYHSKLLSHRFRGLAEFEHSKDSFQHIRGLNIKYFELDTRVSKDGEIVVCHNDGFTVSGKRYKIAQLTGVEINALHQQKRESLLLLRDALQLFTEHSNPKQMLCIDIKDHGFEQQHLDLVRAYHLERRVIFITWIPQVIIRLNELGSRSALIFSYWDISKLNLIGGLAARAISGLIRPLGHYIVIGEKRINDSLQGLSVGYNTQCLAPNYQYY